MNWQALIASLPWLLYLAGLYFSYRFGKFVKVKHLASKVYELDGSVGALAEVIMREQKRKAAEASGQRRTARAQAAVPSDALAGPDPEAVRAQLRQHFMAKEGGG